MCPTAVALGLPRKEGHRRFKASKGFKENKPKPLNWPPSFNFWNDLNCVEEVHRVLKGGMKNQGK